MTLRTPEYFDNNDSGPSGYDGRDDGWQFLADYLPHNCRPMDFDFVVERHGRFFLCETKFPYTTTRLVDLPFDRLVTIHGSQYKEFKDLRVPLGQYITLKKLSKDPKWTIVIRSKQRHSFVGWTELKNGKPIYINGTPEDLGQRIAKWFAEIEDVDEA